MNYKKTIKSSKIKIFTLEKKRDLDGFVSVVKSYIHPIDSNINAYIRDISSTEKISLGQELDVSIKEIVINKRKITKDMYVEFKGQTYNILSIDSFDDLENEIKLRVVLVNNEIQFDSEEGSIWQ